MDSSISKNNYYKHLDIIRIFSCAMVFLYHLGYLKGGFLAVNLFFVLSGYLTFISAYRDKYFSIKCYYKKRLKKLYLPLLMVVFLSLAVIPLISKSNWFNLKPETTSVLLGYNNFWQLSASLDYFSRHIDSPFMHLWFISILMQFDLIFPIIYKILKKTKSKINKMCDAIIIFLLAILSYLGFYYFSVASNMMMAYYHTLFRVFSLLFGVLIGMLHAGGDSLILPELKKDNKPQAIIVCYLLIMFLFFLNIEASNRFFQMSMIIITIISFRIIDYATCIKESSKKTPIDFLINKTARISYEFYLVQYPVIYALQYVSLPIFYKALLVFIVTSFLAFLINYSLDFYHNKKVNIKKLLIYILLIFISCYGILVYMRSEDHSKEMARLEKELANNQKLIAEKQSLYAQKIQEQKDKLEAELELIEQDKNNMGSFVKNITVVGIGDSVMLGAVNNLYEMFPNGYFDAQVSRSTWVVNGILQELDSKSMLGEVVVINMGANGDCSESCKDEILNTIGNRKAFWLTNTNIETDFANNNIIEYAKKHPNLHIIDWKELSKGHDEYFYADGIHLTIPGRIAYANVIYDAIYEVYEQEYENKSKETIQVFEETIKNKYEFYGNDLLLSTYQYLINDFIDSKFSINSYDFNTLKDVLSKKYSKNELSNRIVLVFDSSFKMTSKQYKELKNALKKTTIYLVYINNNFESHDKNTVLIDFNTDLANNNEYLISDLVHLSSKGSKALANKVINTLEKGE